MRAGAAPTDFLLPESVPATRARPPPAVSATQFIAMEDGEARGGFIELLHPAWLNGSVQTVANYQSPLSEGICDKKYGLVGMQMIRYIQQQRPYLFVVGMGDPGNPLPRLLRASNWSVFPVPFLFRVENAGRFLREVRTLRSSATKRMAASVAALTGAGWIGLRVLRGLSLPAMLSARRYSIEPLQKWGSWADELWEQFREPVFIRCAA